MPFVRVALDVPVNDSFDYRAADACSDDVGRLAVVPFGRGRKVGVIVEVTAHSAIEPQRIRAVARIARDLPRMPETTLELFRFCARYYHHPLGETILNALPTALRKPDGTALAARSEFVRTAEGEQRSVADLPARAHAQRALFGAFATEPVLTTGRLREGGPAAKRALTALMARGWLTEREAAAVPTDAVPPAVEVAPGLELTPEQRTAVDAVIAELGDYRCHLLYGVTGSGKTEVYLRLIEAAAGRGEQTLLLVPEINLTPQLEARLAERLGTGRLAILHSGLAEGERLERWLRAVRGEAVVVAGTRLAVFTPLPRLGLVIVDEEHDGSYKQQEGLRYSARDVAVFLGKQRSAAVVLGSATPSLESWRQAQQRRYRLLRLPNRASSRLPDIRTVETRGVTLVEGLAPALVDAIRQTLGRGEQSLIFVNRRGFAPTLLCHECGWIAPCHRCSARLTLHATAQRLRCHYCGHEERIPQSCPSCGNQDLRALGAGTQRIEQALTALFPKARIARIDRDSTRRRNAFHELRERIEAHDLDILVGTQMLAKGHDFPRLTLVGVLGADNGLLAADFRAEERLFALLLQVAGRAGRAALPGQALIQTEFPQHPMFQSLIAHDFEGFAQRQLDQRKAGAFPPFLHQALLRAEATQEAQVFEVLNDAVRQARPLADGITLYDPVPALMPKVAGKWRGQLLIQSASRNALHAFLDNWWPQIGSNRVRMSIDVDPLDF
jgi:primosomal protein N' (replication factor Y) (superfamily II helicase)